MPPFRVVVAPDSFKGSVAAGDAATALAAGWRDVRPGDAVTELPQADGGEGTLDAIARAVPGSELVAVGPVGGPDGRPLPGDWLRLPDGTAVLELARSSGLPLLVAPDPLEATTRGLGEVIAAALDAGATRLVIGLGGSASTDGGAGALAALGLRLRDARRHPLADGGGALADLAAVDRTALRATPRGGVRLLTDVDAPLLGPGGGAAVFGPQKGATPDHIRRLEAGLGRLADLLGGEPDAPGAGAAGGAGFGLAAWGGRIEPGAAAIAALTGLPDAVAAADLVITGEGRFDATSLAGKATGNVLALAARHGVRAAVVAGSFGVLPDAAAGCSVDAVALTVDPTGRAMDAVSLADLAGSVDAALADPIRHLRAASAELARTVD